MDPCGPSAVGLIIERLSDDGRLLRTGEYIRPSVFMLDKLGFETVFEVLFFVVSGLVFTLVFFEVTGVL